MAKKKIKRLYRAKEKDSVIGGVCAGIADYFDLDPVVVRIITILLTLMWGAGIIAYILAWLIMPRK